MTGITELALEDVWSAFALRVECGPVELRVVADDDIPLIAGVAVAGIHEPGEMPFAAPWSEAPTVELPRNIANYYWANRASFTPEKWTLDLVVRHHGTVVGALSADAEHYRLLRQAETGSWLGKEFQGRGIGTLARQALCTLMFDELAADELTSGAWVDNPRSLAVSRRIGYAPTGTRRLQRRPGEAVPHHDLLLTPDRFVRAQHPVLIEGADQLRMAIGMKQLPNGPRWETADGRGV